MKSQRKRQRQRQEPCQPFRKLVKRRGDSHLQSKRLSGTNVEGQMGQVVCDLQRAQ